MIAHLSLDTEATDADFSWEQVGGKRVGFVAYWRWFGIYVSWA